MMKMHVSKGKIAAGRYVCVSPDSNERSDVK